MEPAPPPITIVDPNNPGGTAELLDNGAQPWRATPRQKVAVALTAMIVALVSGGVADIRHVHHERSLDASVVHDVSFTAAEPPDYGDGQILLTNEGRLPVHVLGVMLVGAGYDERRHDVALAAQDSSTLSLSTTKNCRPELFTDEPTKLRVRARTSRGAVVTRTLTLPDELVSEVGYWERYRCGYQRPEEALTDEVVSTARRGADVVVTVKLYNESVVPLTVAGLGSAPGVSVTADLPITLPRRAYWTGRSPARRLTLTLHVFDCALFAQALGGMESTDSVFGLVEAELSNTYTNGTADVSLVDEVAWDDDQPPVSAAQRLLMKTCA